MTNKAPKIDPSLIDHLNNLGFIIRSHEERFAWILHLPNDRGGNRREYWTCSVIHLSANGQLKEVESFSALDSILYWDEDKQRWIFSVWEWTPGPGPGDFENYYTTLEEAVTDVEKYYFGDPKWMNPLDLKEYEKNHYQNKSVREPKID